MSNGGPGPSPNDTFAELQAALEGSACLGVWTLDLTTDRFAAAGSLGRALALPEREKTGVPLERMLGAVHAEDRMRIESVLHAAFEAGGAFETEFRTRALQGGGDERWLRLMGRTEFDRARRAVRSRGVAFDLTERRGAGSPFRQSQQRVNQLADHAIAMKGLVADLDNPMLARLADALAVEVGFELARQLKPAKGGSSH